MNPEYITDFRSRLHAISLALILAADKPIFYGVGGGITTGDRSVELALDAEFQGALGMEKCHFVYSANHWCTV